MNYQTIFKRYELKYLLTDEQKEKIIYAMEPYAEPDIFGQTTVRNIYFDTDNFRLIRNSVEKPVYKEKLRIRSYKRSAPDSGVFVELKKKYDYIVYKRRIEVPEHEAMSWLGGGESNHGATQISNEIDYFLKFYGALKPAVFLTYEREAYHSVNGSDLRITFDENMLFRQEQMSLQADVYGIPLLERGKILMEIKCSGGIPLWLVKLLSDEKIYKTSFSKYGTAYRILMSNRGINEIKEIKINA